MPNNTWPDWEQVLSAAARLQHILPEAVLVGGTASALYAEHRLSTDANHVLPDLRELSLAEYKNLDPRWQNWETVKAACAGFATLIFDRIVGLDG